MKIQNLIVKHALATWKWKPINVCRRLPANLIRGVSVVAESEDGPFYNAEAADMIIAILSEIDAF